jgi:CHAD domain-containing protein
MVTAHVEVERKYDVPTSTTVESVTVPGGLVLTQPGAEVGLVAVYHDTANLDLARHGVTLRRRTGGADAGWHLKLPAGPDERTEAHHRLGDDDEPVPDPLLAPIRALVRDRPLVPVARLSTRRVEHPLRGPDGQVVAQLCDDRVTAERLLAGEPEVQWREWEVELTDGDRSVLDTVEAALLAAGATPATARSKLQRALGREGPTAAAVGSAAAAGATAGEVLTAYVAAQVERLVTNDRGVRADAPDSVHQMRVAARRLRSALATHRRLLVDRARTERLRAELKWFGQALGRARDAQVLQAHLDGVLGAEPPDLVIGPVAERIDAELTAEFRAGQAEAQAALDSERYFRLLDALDDLADAPEYTEDAGRAASELEPRLLARDAKRLRHAVQAVDRAEDPASRDAALHEARKKAKRLRYAAECAEPALGPRAAKLARRAEALQEALGEFQDSVVARSRLRELGVQAHLSGENAFTYGRLHALEQQRADRSERVFRSAWRKLPHRRVRRWLGRARPRS